MRCWRELDTRDDVLALSFPVDYWDYLGWKDTLANPKFTERQKAYKSTLGVPMIYTPMMVVGGLTQVNGSDEDKVLLAIEKSARIVAATRVPLRIVAKGGHLVIEAGAVKQNGHAEGSNAVAGDRWPRASRCRSDVARTAARPSPTTTSSAS